MNRGVRSLIAATLSFPVTFVVAAGLVGGGTQGVREAFLNGGFFMLLVTAMLLVQGGLVVLAGALDKDNPAPLGLYLLGPMFVATVGAVGYMTGLGKIQDALHFVSGADRFLLFFVGSREAGHIVAYGLIGAGLGLLSVATLGLLDLFGGGPSRSDAHKASGALLVLVGGTLGAWAVGRALVELARGTMYKTYGAVAAPGAKVAAIHDALDVVATRQLGMHLATGLLFLVGLALVVSQHKNVGALLAVRRLGTLSGAVIAAAGLGVTVFALGANERHYAALVELDDMQQEDATRGATGPLPRAPGLRREGAKPSVIIPVRAAVAPDLPTSINATDIVVLHARADVPAREVVAVLERIEARRVGVLVAPDQLDIDPVKLAEAGVLPFREGTGWLAMPVKGSSGDVGVLVDDQSGSLQQLIDSWGPRQQRGDIFLTTHPEREGKDPSQVVQVEKDKRERDRKIAMDALAALGLGKAPEGEGLGRGGLGEGINNALGGLRGAQLGEAGLGVGGLGASSGSGPGARRDGLGIGGLGGANAKRPPAPAAKREELIKPGKVTYKGALNRGEIERVLRRVKGQLRYCYERELNRTSSLAGKIAVSFVINGNGLIASAKAAQNTLRGAPGQKVANCSLRIIKRLRFPKPRGGGQVFVTYPFVYSAGS